MTHNGKIVEDTAVAVGFDAGSFFKEYTAQQAALPELVAQAGRLANAMRQATSCRGVFCYDAGYKTPTFPSLRELEKALRGSAWEYIYKHYKFDVFLPASDKDKIKAILEVPPELTPENMREVFGKYVVEGARGAMLRGLAEVFCTLDPAYKSHSKVKIGVNALPKRIILPNVGGYSSYGRERLTNTLNALAAYQGKPLLEYSQIEALIESEDALRTTHGVWLKRFSNGNGHLYFSDSTLTDINKALAEYYGDVLPDEAGEKPTQKQGSTAVSKDLQYYPTPQKVVDVMLRGVNFSNDKDMRALEPSCGCGRILDALKKRGISSLGYEYDAGRAQQAKAKGHAVVRANFLEVTPDAGFDYVFMNPPFYGKHYQKHVLHALKFLKSGGELISILPATAHYDHGFTKDVNGLWQDLPVGSFSKSGTNVPTGILTIRKK